MIPKRLYIGGRISSNDWLFVHDNISAVINLQTLPDRPPFDFSNRVMIWTPLYVWTVPTIDWLDRLITQIMDLFRQGHRILIHCRFGIHRLGFVTTAFYMKQFGLTSEEALAAVKEKRPIVNPPEHYRQVLKQYEQFLNVN